jgi:tetratricopeptide (TPR) repeat protein
MNAVNGTLLRILYPAVSAQIPPQDLPQNHNYARILRDAERGVYSPVPSSRDFLELVLPFLAYYNGQSGSRDQLLAALPDLQRAQELNPASVLPPYFIGIIFERTGRLEEAFEQYTKVWALSSECYPAALSMARVLDLQSRAGEAVELLLDLAIHFPDNLQIKRQLAIAYYKAGDWSRAEPAIAEILQRDNRDGDFILMRAHIMVEQGQFVQAQAPLDIYASINPNNRLYLFLRARVQFEGYRNRDAALTYLRSLLRNAGGAMDDDASVYAARLFMESSREADQTEGRNLLTRLLDDPAPSLTVITLALQDAIRRQAWAEARPYMGRLLSERRSSQDLLDAYTVEKEQGNNAAALSYARELYQRDSSFEEGTVAYITALIDTGRREEAARIIDTRLRNAPAGAPRSRYHFLLSRTRTNEEDSLNDLRSSLFEDPRNLNALIAMFEIYHRRRDERRAVYYLKQALALAPNNPQLKRYEEEYAPLL